jgi:hypothetical protein
MLDTNKSCSQLWLLLTHIVANCECHVGIDRCAESNAIDSMVTGL